MDANVLDGQVEQLHSGLVAGEAAMGLDDLAERPVQAPNSVCGVDHFSDVRREGEQWDHVLPGPPPGLADGRISGAPAILEPGQSTPRRT